MQVKQHLRKKSQDMVQKKKGEGEKSVSAKSLISTKVR